MILRLRHILTLVSVLVLSACANMVTPTGGPKDVTPPQVVEASPENRSTDFDGRRIEVTFDEYVTLNNASQQVLVSPPLSEKPDIKLNNKTVVIRLKEDLKPNTTYTIDFGEAVKDLHEGNLFKDYTYAFSTGDQLDTLTLSGTLLDAASLKPVEKMFVSLYRHCEERNDEAIQHDPNQPDSGWIALLRSAPLAMTFDQPLNQAPDYLTRTDKDGHFTFHGLPDQSFLIFALEDMNANLFYDMPNETVAFLDTLVCPSDSLQYTLYAFTEADTTQMLLENKLVEEGLLRFAFRQPADSVAFHIETPTIDSFRMVEVWSVRHDTLYCWFTPNVIDSLPIRIHYDTLINIDTRYNLRPRETKTSGHADARELKVGNNLHNKKLMPGENLTLLFPEPVTDLRLYDTAILIGGADTLYINSTHFQQTDTLGLSWYLDVALSDTVRYMLVVPDSAFFSVRGRTHKALHLDFSRAGEADFGNILVQVQPPLHTQVVVQLLDNKGKIVATQVVAALSEADPTATVEFRQLFPDKYKLRAIIDTDADGQWSSGNFHHRFLPETVISYKDELDLKAGWDIAPDEIWKL